MSITDYISPDMRARIKAHDAPVLLGNPVLPALCPACGGLGEMRYLFLSGDNTSGQQTWHAGRWWRYDDVREPCPVCGVLADRQAIYRSLAGLEPGDWELDPSAYINDTAKRPAIEAALEILSRVPRPYGLLAIHGAPGVGKSCLARAVVAKSVRAGVHARYATAGRYLAELRSCYNGQGDERLVMSEYEFVPLLVLDECDRASDTGWARERLFALLDARYRARMYRATILITNTLPGQFGPEWAYLESRLNHGRRTIMGGRDLRKEKTR